MGDNVQFVKGVYEALANGDLPTVLAAFDPRIEWNEAEHVTFWNGSPFIGPDAVVQGVLARVPATFGDTFWIEVSRLHDCGSVVVMEGRYHGVVQATGKTVDAQVTHVWDIADGKLVRGQQYTDTWQFAEATGETPWALSRAGTSLPATSCNMSWAVRDSSAILNILNGMRCSVVTSICVSPIDTTQLLNPLSWVAAVRPSSRAT